MTLHQALFTLEGSSSSAPPSSAFFGYPLFRAFGDSRLRMNVGGVGTAFDTSSGVANISQWNTYMLEYDVTASAAYRLVCNGTLIGSGNLSTPWATGAVALQIGAGASGYISGARLTRSIRYLGTNPTQSDYVANYLT